MKTPKKVISFFTGAAALALLLTPSWAYLWLWIFLPKTILVLILLLTAGPAVWFFFQIILPVKFFLFGLNRMYGTR